MEISKKEKSSFKGIFPVFFLFCTKNSSEKSMFEILFFINVNPDFVNIS